MWEQYTTAQKAAYLSLAAMVIFGTSLVGRYHLKSTPEISLDGATAQQQKEPLPLAPDESELAPAVVVVHVVGEVRSPGIYRLPSSARVHEAIEKAGVLPSAELSVLNLAAKVTDGIQIRVPSKLEARESVTPPATSTAPVTSVSTPSTGGPTVSSSHISINSASQAELEALPGIGPATAQKIILYRQQHGGFRSIEELEAVSGIGPKKLAAIRPFISL